MALTPYPSLATLPEVVANGGKIPARTVDAFSTRTVYASSITGVVLDCDIHAGKKIGGGTPTDNAAKLNAVLATATSASPVHLIIDGGCALGAALSIPVTGNVTISGLGWGTGFFWLSGSNCSQIQTADVGTTNLSHVTAIGPTSPQTIKGSNVVLSNFFMNCNRGTYPTGLVSPGAYDGTVSSVPSGSVDARGLLDLYFITSVLLIGLDNVHIEKLWIFDSPSYHIHLFHCTRVWIDRCRIEAGNPGFNGNTDAIHLNGGCKFVTITDCWGSVGDDFVAINAEEGDATPITDVIVANCQTAACEAGVRIYGKTAPTDRIFISNYTASGNRSRAVVIGDENGNASSVADCNHSVWIDGIDFQSNGAVAPIWVCGNVGSLHVQRVSIIEPTSSIPIVQLDSQCKVSSLVMRDCLIHRNSVSSSPSFALGTNSATFVGNLSIEGLRVTEQYGQTYSDIPALIDLSNATVGAISIDADVSGVATVLNIPSSAVVGQVTIKSLRHVSHAGSPAAHSIVAAGSTVPVYVGQYTASNIATIATGTVTLTGPGLLPSGYAVADALMGNGSLYLGSDHANVPCVKVGGTAHTINLT
jgi:hypothetical protein